MSDEIEIKKVLMTTDTLGGVWTYSMELAAALAPHGVEVCLATMGAPLTRDQWKEARAIPSIDIQESTFKLEWMEQPWSDVEAAGIWLMELADDRKPDIVHLNNYAHGALPWEAPVVVVGHSCVLSWWEAVKGEPAPEEWNAYRHYVAAGLRAADLVVAPTAAMLDALQRHYGPVENTAVIYNGRTNEDSGDTFKEQFVLAAGRIWDEAKNVAALDRIAPRLDWPVYIAGEGMHPDGGTMQVRHSNALGRLPKDALEDWLRRASIYALPARYEPFGLSVLEAAGKGCALVLGDIDTLRELWEGAAVFVPPDDPDAVTETIQTLIKDEPMRIQYARDAHYRAKHFTPGAMAQSYLAAYKQLYAEKAAEALVT